MNNSIIKNQVGLLRELLDGASDVGIIIGESQNIDLVGSALSLFLILKSEGKSVQVISRNEPTVEVASLVGVDKITKSFSGSTKIFTISVPYREGDIDKVSYNIEGDRLFVNLFAEEKGLDINEKDFSYIRKGSSPSLIFTVGLLSEQELASFVEPGAARMINIDRNSQNMLIGDVSLIDPSFSSVSEIVAEMARELSLMPDVDAFQNLLDGIMSATRNFTAPTTSPFAFEAAGFLLQNGAKRKEKSLDAGYTQRQDPGQQQPRNVDSRQRDRNIDDSGYNNQPQNRQNRGDRQDNRQNRGDRQNRSDDRNRNFPNENLFLNPRPPRNQNQNQGQNGQNNAQARPQVPNIPNIPNIPTPPQDNNQQPKPKMNIPFDDVTTLDREASDKDMPNEVIDAPFTEGALPEDIPDDWFLPKVFKGSKKGN